MLELLARWSVLEPERVYIIEDGCGTGSYGITYAGSTFGVALGHDVNEFVRGAPEQIEFDVQDDGAIIVAVQEGCDSRGWGWRKPFMLRTDVELMTYGPLEADGRTKALYRSSDFAGASAPRSLAVNLLDAYLQALEAQ